MIIYGFTEVNTNGFWSGKESITDLCLDRDLRNRRMYSAYSNAFYNHVLSCGRTEDDNGDEKMTQEEFESRINEDGCVGVIQLHDYHVQFEPFSYEL